VAVAKVVNLAVRFLLEVAALTALGYAGWLLGPSAVMSAVLVVVLPLAAALVWGRWVAPKADRRLPDPQRLAVELGVFGAAALGLVAAQQLGWAVALAGVVAANEAALFAWDQRAH
jgi:hypothetical protein